MIFDLFGALTADSVDNRRHMPEDVGQRGFVRDEQQSSGSIDEQVVFPLHFLHDEILTRVKSSRHGRQIPPEEPDAKAKRRSPRRKPSGPKGDGGPPPRGSVPKVPLVKV